MSPSKTPLRDRLNRLSIASTASGMVNFDDEDREEAERRWLEEEEHETHGHDLADVREEDEHASSSSEDEMGNEEEECERMPHMTPSRSSTSLKSILKKSIASAEGIASANASMLATPHRTVTWSPSTLPPAKSPPATDVSPEHPRGPLAAAEAYLLNLGQRQQDEYYQGADSPYRQGANRPEDDSIISSEDSAMEVEEALLSRSSMSISPHNLSTASDAPAEGQEPSDSLKTLGTASQRGTAFMDRLRGLIPSPENSFANSQQSASQQPFVGDAEESRFLDPSLSNLLDTSAPMHSVLQDVTVTDSHPTARQTAGPKPFLLRQSVILEENSVTDTSVEGFKKASTSPTTSPDKSPSSQMRSFQATILANSSHVSSSIHTPIKQSAKVQAAEAIKEEEGSDPLNSGAQDIEIFETPAEDAEPTSSPVNNTSNPDDEDDNAPDAPSSSPSPSLRALPSITPSSSSSSLIKLKPESPFTSLVNHLLSTQDELLSHRADQKTMLISLVSNLRGELASRDRQLDLLESHKKTLERNLRREREDREKDRSHQKERMAAALAEVEETREKLSKEIKRRDDALREELLHEKAKREMVEKQIESMRRDSDGSEEIQYLREQLQDMRETLDEQKLHGEQAATELERTQNLLAESRKEQEHAEARIEASQRAQEDARAQADMLHEECSKLRMQSVAAEKQVSKLSVDFERQMTALRTKLNQAESANTKLKRELDDANYALHNERTEQARQYDMSASIQESMRIDNERLASSVAKLERSKDHSFQQLQVIKKDTAAVLAQKDDRIAQLEAEVIKRTLDRRATSTSQHGPGHCTTCKEASERTGFLESEVVRLREVVGKMRMESADREVKIARLVKTREQLKDDINGLNIALEAKQQEVAMLKRESHRLSGGETNGAAGISMVGTTTSTAPPRSRIRKGRPSSVQDATAAAVDESSTVTAEQRRRSLKARPSAVSSMKRVSIHRSSIDTPSVLSSINANAASGNVLNSAPSARRTGSKDLDSLQHDKALEAASLMKAVKPVVALADKENAEVESKTRQRLRDLPSAPSHALVSAQQANARGRSNSLAAVEA